MGYRRELDASVDVTASRGRWADINVYLAKISVSRERRQVVVGME